MNCKDGDYIRKISNLETVLEKCSVCGRYVSEAFGLHEERYFRLPDFYADALGVPRGTLSLTYANCISKFGHKECLEKFVQLRPKNLYFDDNESVPECIGVCELLN
jgi:hypothetical protein